MTLKLKARDYFGIFPLGVERRPDQEPTPLHGHAKFTELAVVTGGCAVHFNENDSYELMAGDCLVAAGVHGYRECRNFNLINIFFRVEGLPFSSDEAKKLAGYHLFFQPKNHDFRTRLRLSPTGMPRLLTWIEEMEGELRRREPGFEIAATALFMRMVCFLSREYARQGRKNPEEGLRVSEVVSHLERNYRENIRMKELAGIAGFSENQLYRVFRQATGHTPIDYLVRLRISRACGLLRQELHTISDIAFKVGFNDSNFFARQFRKITGTSPREYRSKQAVSA